MNYEIYKKSRNVAWQILIDYNITTLPIKITDLCYKMNIAVKLYTPDDENSGKSFIVDGKPIILISDKDNINRQRFTCAHELWHIINGDVGKYELVNREPSLSDNPIEQAANVFASRLLAPACVLWGIGVKSAEDISRICDISLLSAKYRWERLKLLYERDKFLTSSLERKVFDQFTNYISKNKMN